MTQVISCPGECTVTLVLSPATATPDQYEALLTVFGVALAALAVVWGVRRLLALFSAYES